MEMTQVTYRPHKSDTDSCHRETLEVERARQHGTYAFQWSLHSKLLKTWKLHMRIISNLPLRSSASDSMGQRKYLSTRETERQHLTDTAAQHSTRGHTKVYAIRGKKRELWHATSEIRYSYMRDVCGRGVVVRAGVLTRSEICRAPSLLA
jgi:hypothetical protein